MALVFPNIIRFTVVGSYAGQDCMNILDVEMTNGALGTLTRVERIRLLAGDLLNQWSDHILPGLNAQYTAIEVRWVDLDTEDGSTGSISETDGSTWPETGENGTAGMSGNVYAKIRKQVEGKSRQQRNGILRLGGLSEAATIAGSANTLTQETIDFYNDAFEQLKDGINGGDLDGNINLGVLHTVDRVAVVFSQIATFNCEPVVGTIRRRMPGYGS